MDEIFLLPTKCKEEKKFDIYVNDKPLSQILSSILHKKIFLDLKEIEENYYRYNILDIIYKDRLGNELKTGHEFEGNITTIEFFYKDKLVYQIELEDGEYKEFFHLLELFVENEHFEFLDYILENYPQAFIDYRKAINCFSLTNKELVKLDKKFLTKILTENINFYIEKDKTTKDWLSNLELIKENKFPINLLPEYLQDIYEKYKKLAKKEHFLKIKYELLKKETEKSVDFLFKLNKAYKLSLDYGGNICFSNKEVSFKPFPANPNILMESGIASEELQFGFTKILDFYRFLKFFEKKLYIFACKFVKQHFEFEQINTFINHYFSLDELVNFVIEAKFDNFEEKTGIWDYLDFRNYLTDKMETFYTRVVGENYHIKNEDYLSALKENDPVYAIWDYKNPYDENAVAILDKNGQHIGYLKKEIAQILSPKLKKNLYLQGRIHKIFPQNRPNERMFVELFI